MKKIAMMLLTLFACFMALPQQGEASSEKKIGILFSDVINDYSLSTNPGKNNAMTLPYATRPVDVSAKVKYSPINDKALKMYYFYREEGFSAAKMSHDELNSLEALNKYDAIVFPYSVLMNQKQRENVKAYIYGGGNVQILYATARNELAKLAKSPSDLDVTPLIFDTLTWVWEWDNLTEIFQTRFIDDVQLRDATITNTPGVTHPILTKAYEKLGRNSLHLSEAANEWYEIVQPWKSSVKPLLVISGYSWTDKPANIKKGQSGALFALEHGAGRIVQAPFKIYDYVGVEKHEGGWQEDSGKPYHETKGEEDAEAVLSSSMEWLLEGSNTFKPRNYNVKLAASNYTANMTPQKTFAVRGTVTATNTGDVPVRGKLRVNVLDSSNKPIGRYEKVLVGLSPAPNEISSYAEKFEILLPGSIKDGKYTVKATFEETRHDRSGYITRAETHTVTKQGNKGTFASFPGFKDVGMSNGHHQNILNAAKLGVITGYGDQTFKPAANVSRLNAMMMLLRAKGVSPSASAALPVTVTDLKKGMYGYDVIATAYQMGLLNLENGQAAKDAPMRRGEMAQSLVKGFGLQGTSDMIFTDIGTASSYNQYRNIATLYHHRITTGTTATLYSPYSPVTRQQFATFIMRSLENTSK
jgi:hypothetical protein